MSYFHPRKAFGNEDVIYKARQYENALQERMQFVHNYERLMRYAQFEQLNGPRSSHHSLAERLAAVREEREQALLQRRHKLSILLTGEDAILQNEIKTGNMNLSQRRAWLLSQALALSSQGVLETNLEKVLYEDHNQVSMHNSKLAVRRERRRQSAKTPNIHQGPGLDGSNLTDDELEAANILQQHLFLVEHLREAEKAAVGEDMLSMHRMWLEEEETLKLKQLEQRHKDSVQAQDLLLCKVKAKTDARESDQDGYVVAMVADKERGEEKELEELRAAHKREALAYVSQLKAMAERQGIEDEELQATIKATMSMHALDNQLLSCPGNIAGQYCKSMAAHAHDDDYDQNLTSTDWGKIHDTSSNQRANIASDQLCKEDLVDVLENETRHARAAQLVDQQVNRSASGQAGGKDFKKPNETARMKQVSANTDLPFPEPYYGRKAVKWYQ